MSTLAAPAKASSRNAVARLLAALVALAAILGAATFPHSEHYGLLDGLAGAAVAEGALHPDAPSHLEGSALKLHPGCPACLLQLHTQSQPAPRGASVPAPPPRGPVIHTAPRLFSGELLSPGHARAPPFSLALV